MIARFYPLVSVTALIFCGVVAATSQQPAETKPEQEPKKANARVEPTRAVEPFDGASIEKLAAQCVKLETEAGNIDIEMLAEMAPETVRNFLNLVSIGAFDTTTFSRVVPRFVIQGGNLATRQNLTEEMYRRSQRTVPDEPSIIKHVRGIVSMARPEESNSATSHFFILVADAANLNGKFSAFGRVRSGMEVADQINQGPVNGEKPERPVRLNRVSVKPCSQ
ncbi:MAG TPA: peptidylprolyl isomerase [Pyrinomonadaceae bacterium]|nr:peptidylprolyl isomerase [Pyrinomonadaceae bacterium]